MTILDKILLAWVVFTVSLFGYYIGFGDHVYLRNHPPQVAAYGEMASINELTERFNQQAITTYGVIEELYSTQDDSMEFILRDSHNGKSIFCSVSPEVLRERPDRKRVLLANKENGERIYIRGIVWATLSSAEIEVRQVFSL